MSGRETLEKLLAGAKTGIVPSSVVEADGVAYAYLVVGGAPHVAVAGPNGCSKGFHSNRLTRLERDITVVCPLTAENAAALRRALPFTAPRPLHDQPVTIGLGDRLGIAGPGHLAAIRAYQAAPVLAQQSVRELTLTSRSFSQVIDASTWAVFREGYREAWGADGDHLKTPDQVSSALAAGCTMITADVSESLHGEHLKRSDGETAQAYAGLPTDYRATIETRYLGRSFPVEGGVPVSFSSARLQRAALVYRDAILHAARLYQACAAAKADGFDFELSIDETDTPTTPEAHLFIAMEARAAGVTIHSLAPRFVGEFQKAVDYIGDLPSFERLFAAHAAVARSLGHRISVHSGSDKFAVFPSVGRLTGGRFHLKTAGTSWLEALRVVAAADAGLFRELYAVAVRRYGNARKLYHVTPDLSRLPTPERLSPADGRALLDDGDARRVLHIAYGEILSVPELKKRLFDLLGREAQAYRSALEAHMGRHLELLGVPSRAS